MYPPEYGWLSMRPLLLLLLIIGYDQIRRWTCRVVKRGRKTSHTRTFLVVSTLCLISAFVVALFAYDPYSSPFWIIILLIWLSILNFFPIYTLLRRKIIQDRWFILTMLTGIICLLVLAPFIFPSLSG